MFIRRLPGYLGPWVWGDRVDLAAQIVKHRPDDSGRCLQCQRTLLDEPWSSRPCLLVQHHALLPCPRSHPPSRVVADQTDLPHPPILYRHLVLASTYQPATDPLGELIPVGHRDLPHHDVLSILQIVDPRMGPCHDSTEYAMLTPYSFLDCFLQGIAE